MAISPVVASTVQVRLLWNINGQLGVNVLHGIVSDGFVANQSVANTLGSAIKQTFTTNSAVNFNSGTSLVRVGLRDMRSPNRTEFLDVGLAAPGTAVGDALPSHIAACITLRTNLSGKSYRGRIYYGGFAEAQNDASGNMFSALATALMTLTNNISAAMTASQITLAVTSRPSEAFVITKTTTHNDGTTTETVLTRSPARPGGSNAVIAVANRDLRWETQRRRSNSRGVTPSTFGDLMVQHLQPAPAQ